MLTVDFKPQCAREARHSSYNYIARPLTYHWLENLTLGVLYVGIKRRAQILRALTRWVPSISRYSNAYASLESGEEIAQPSFSHYGLWARARQLFSRQPSVTTAPPALLTSTDSQSTSLSFEQAVGSGLSSALFDISKENIRESDTRGLPEKGVLEIQTIMKEHNVNFDQARLIKTKRMFKQMGVNPETGMPLDKKAVYFVTKKP